MHLYFVLFKFEHHGIRSGYDHLVDYLPDGKVVTTRRYESMINWINRQNRVIRSLGNRMLGNKRHLIEYLLTQKTPNLPDTLVHFLYPENMYRNFGHLKKQRKLICTFHQPPEFFKKDYLQPENRQKYHLIDQVIVISNDQYHFFADLLGEERVTFIPHGVDTGYFCPNSAVKKKHQVLVVGNWLRDFQMLREICQIMFLRDKTLHFEVISRFAAQHGLGELPNVHLRNDISNEELLKAFRESKILLLPLTGATANNALLEGMACGLPIIITDVGGISDYANDSHALLVDKEAPAEFYAERLGNLLGNEQKLQTLGEEARINVLNFRWPLIAKRLLTVYEYSINGQT